MREKETIEREFALQHKADKEDTHLLEVTLLEVTRNRARVFTNFDGDTATFSVEYFDTPFTDNTLLQDGHRVALMLKGTDITVHPHEAILKVVEFPANYILSGYRPSVEQVDELLGDLGK